MVNQKSKCTRIQSLRGTTSEISPGREARMPVEQPMGTPGITRVMHER